MNIFADFNARIVKAVETLDLRDKEGGVPDLSRIAVEPPRDATHGDLATNAAMVLAKPTGQNPRALAERLAAALREDKDIASAEIAGPGFVNLKLRDGFWQAHLTALLGEGRNYGRSKIGGGRKANVEYAMPKEGLVGWLDSYVVPKGAANIDNAKKFINFMAEEENATAQYNYYGHSTPMKIDAAKALYNKENAPELFPTVPVKMGQACSPAAQELVTKVWTQLLQ